MVMTPVSKIAMSRIVLERRVVRGCTVVTLAGCGIEEAERQLGFQVIRNGDAQH